MADWREISQAEALEAIEAGYTIREQFQVEYDDRVVDVPPQRPLDLVAAEKHFPEVRNFAASESVGLFLIWRRLGRHEDANEHPGEYEEWMPELSGLSKRFFVDLERKPLPKVLNLGGGNS